jgi:hypothetical protein
MSTIPGDFSVPSSCKCFAAMQGGGKVSKFAQLSFASQIVFLQALSFLMKLNDVQRQQMTLLLRSNGQVYFASFVDFQFWCF